MKTALAALLAALAGAGLVYWKDHRDLAALRAEVVRLSKPAPAASSAEAPPLPAPAAPASSVRQIEILKVPSHDDAATRQELVRLLDEKNSRIAGHDAAMRELRERLADVEAKLAQSAREQEQFSSSRKGLEEQLDTATRMAESLRELARGREERLAQAEVSSQELRKRGEDAARKLAKLAELTAQMDDVARRRDVYLNNVLRRYREATELFRTLALRIDNPDLSRIQQTIGSADEDLRQIHTLDAQASRLQKDLALARK